MRKLILSLLLLCSAMGAFAQRPTDKLDRGLIAMPSATSGIYVSWRIFGEEYYDTKYNLYRDGTLVNQTPLNTSNYNDAAGKSTSTYQVAAVVRGVEQTKCDAVRPWSNQYTEFSVQPVYGRDGTDITTSHSYIINDISLADVDGDGQEEFIVKRLNNADYTDLTNKNAYNFIECYKLNGTRLWWIDCGPNLVSGSSVELDAVGYDWDGDGKAEVLMRGADNMVIHEADGTVYNVGDMTADTRWSGMEYTTSGKEYLVYLEGATAKPYQIVDFPLPRYDAGESTDEASIWGAGIAGHRPNKFFFGAPFLDGRHASIFLGRGIYTREKMVALDVDPSTHALTERWRWKCYTSGSPWFGQGYHNFGIADVDWDGRDEIVYGSMVIDDNGKGLSTTGLGHGDAQHCSDFDPYRHGQEIFACNETSPNMNYRNATTSKLYYRSAGTSDDGRALCGNFSNKYPGCTGRSTNTGMVSCTADKVISELDGLIAWGDLNFRIYWDGDLLEEILNSPGVEREAKIEKPGTGRIFTSSGCQMNNWTKDTPCVMGDVFGDWREEIVLRANNNTKIRIYSTPTPTTWRNYTLWHDYQYRNGMVWEMCGYNQPPHVSYFLGELEGITVAPPPLTMTGRTEIANGGTISTANANQHVIVCETNNTSINVADGANPYIATFNVPSWTQGHDNNSNITTDYYTCSVKGGAFTGSMRLVKQGDGILSLPAVEEAYTGNTDIWAGTLNFDGKLLHSPLWLNRFAVLNSNGGQFRSIRMDYASILRPGGAATKGSVTVDSLKLGFGSRVVLDIYGADLTADQIAAKYVSIETKDWDYGPTYNRPVIEFVQHPATGATELAEGKYLLGTIGTLSGNISDVKVEGLSAAKKNTLSVEDGKLYITIEGTRAATSIAWDGSASTNWSVASDANFSIDGQAGQVYVNGDDVTFDDNATSYNVNLPDAILPASVTVVNNSNAYTFSGSGSLTGTMGFTKDGASKVTMTNDNTYTGGNYLKGGTVVVNSLSNSTQAFGNLGSVTTLASKFTMQEGAVLNTTAAVTMGSPMQMIGEQGGVINNASNFVLEKSVTGTALTKTGAGWLTIHPALTVKRLILKAGGASAGDEGSLPGDTLEFAGNATYQDNDNSGSYSNRKINIRVDSARTGLFNMDGRCVYTGSVVGTGKLQLYCTFVRTDANWDFSNFEGTLEPTSSAYTTFLGKSNLQKAILNIPDKCWVNSSSSANNGTAHTLTMAGLTGSGTLTANSATTFTVGDDRDFTFAGALEAGKAHVFVKQGTGTMTFSGASTHTGATTVKAGTLYISSTTGTFGTGSITVNAGAMLSGASKGVWNNPLFIKGTLRAINSATAITGTLDIGGKNVTVSTGGALEFSGYSKATFTRLTNIGTLSMADGSIVRFLPRSTMRLVEGDTLQVVTATTLKIGNVTYDLPDLGGGLEWDTSFFATRGILAIKVSTGISAFTSDTPATVTVTTPGGALVSQFRALCSDAERQFRALPLAKGLYLITINANGRSVTKKVMK
jgi:autotransporter-associated beta strand protein